MKKAVKGKSILRKVITWVLSIFVILLISLFAIPSIFNDLIANEIKKGINQNLETELQFKDSNISFFNHFPSLTFSFENVNLSGSKPFEKDTLVVAQELGFGINVFKLIFSDRVVINETYLTNCKITLMNDKVGNNNYNIYKTSDTTTTEVDSSGIDLRLNLKHLKIENATVVYKDAETGISVSSINLNYNGRGGIKNGKLKLGSQLEIASINVVFDNIDYLSGKKLKAKSLTIYDTENFSIELDRNDISLNDLDVSFNGKLNIFDEGFAYDLNFNSEDGTIQDLVSALPPKYAEWSTAVELDGDLDATLRLAGYTGNVPKTSQLNLTDVSINIYDGTIKHNSADQPIKNLYLKFKGSLENNFIDASLDSLNFSLNNEITRGKIKLLGTTDSLYINSNITSNINLTTLNQTLKLPDYNFNGVLATNIKIDGIYQPSASHLPKTNGNFKLSNGFLQTSHYPEPIKNIELDAITENNGQTYSEASLTIRKLNFSFLDNQFTSAANFKNFDDPEYDLSANGFIDFTTLNQVIDLPLIIENGQLIADLKLKGKLNNPQSENINSGTLEVKDVTLNTEQLQYSVLIKEGKFAFFNNKMAFSKLSILHKSSDLAMDGYFQNYLDYALMSKGILKGDVKLKSPKIDITEFFPKEKIIQQTDSTSTIKKLEEVASGVLQIPENIDLNFQVNIDSLIYNALNITTLEGQLALKEQSLLLKNTTLQMADGKAEIDVVYKPLDTKKALFSMDIKATDFNIEKGYNSVAIFKELAPAAAQASGIISIDYSLAGTLDQTMFPIMPELSGKGTLKAHSIKFDGYKLMGKVSKKSGFETLDNPEVSEITINSTLNNNVLNLERFKFKVRPFKLRAEGQTSLEGDLSIKMRIGLPPFGLIGIPVVVEGSSDDFDVKVGTKTSDLDTLGDDTEDSYSEEDLLRMNMLKDSIRDGMSIDEINKMQEKIESIQLDSLKTQPIDSLNVSIQSL
ncbi:hypothetical protein KO500_11605 [Cellulophaga baltica]|uniref:AsmA-like C-terminal region-containing protein n=1 Tax=Cellulophaga TaxID=104264 RepID=UPI001C065477|nr:MULTISPECIES: AsmA-like C-terminal region-containing protein [Cellulophaga]MBU2997085.1 hypothetical protein [Cellulophaga baltica]MDO6768483.1 AsmA-like C-terminal region-containing protein [Cellulophaga sp. 1_MG-2023]